jgi:hypothetical protein
VELKLFSWQLKQAVLVPVVPFEWQSIQAAEECAPVNGNAVNEWLNPSEVPVG